MDIALKPAQTGRGRRRDLRSALERKVWLKLLSEKDARRTMKAIAETQ